MTSSRSSDSARAVWRLTAAPAEALPLLEQTWGDYYAGWANPESFDDALVHLQREVDATASLAAGFKLQAIYREVGD